MSQVGAKYGNFCSEHYWQVGLTEEDSLSSEKGHFPLKLAMMQIGNPVMAIPRSLMDRLMFRRLLGVLKLANLITEITDMIYLQTKTKGI